MKARAATVVQEEPNSAPLALQLRYIDVGTNPVDAFDRELDLILKDYRHALCRGAPGLQVFARSGV
jgi:hypothetical protein